MSIQLTLTIALAIASSAPANEATNVMLMPITSSDKTIDSNTKNGLQEVFKKELADLQTQVTIGSWPDQAKKSKSIASQSNKSAEQIIAAVEQQISRGKRSLRKRRYQRARRSFTVASNMLRANAEMLQSPQAWVRCQRLIALTQFRQGKKQAARTTLAAMLPLAGNAPAKAGTFSKKFTALEADVRTEATSAKAGSLHVARGNQVETVYVDGKAMGRTPLIIEAVAPGTHLVRLERNGTFRSTVVDVVSEQRASTNFAAKKARAHSVVERIEQNRFDATVRRAALERAKKNGADIVVVASLERSIVGMVYTAFMGRVSDGTWTRLGPVRADMDLLSASVGLSDLAAQLKAEQHTAGIAMGNQVHTFRPEHALATHSPSIARPARTVSFTR